MPAPEPPNSLPSPPVTDPRAIPVNLDVEIMKLAQRDGLTDPALLVGVVSMTRRENYANTVVAYYQGYDQGFASGLSNAAGPIIAFVRFRGFMRRVMRHPAFWIIVGTVVGYLLSRWFGVHPAELGK